MSGKAQQQSRIKELITRGREQGYLTYAEVNDHLPEDISDPEQVEDIIRMINDMGINVFESAPDADALLLAEADTDEAAAEEAAAALAAVETDIGRTTDPVRMYMREMGTVELLTREGEIAIAKRIEEGLGQMQAALGLFPASVELVLGEYEQHKEGKKRLAEVVVGFNDLVEEESAPAVEEDTSANDSADGADEDESDDDESGSDEDAAPTGPDPEEVARRMDVLADLLAKFRKAHAKHGSEHKAVSKLREEMSEVFVTLKFPLPFTDVLVRQCARCSSRSRTRSAACCTWPP